MKNTPLPYFFSERSLFLSVRCTENPAGCMDRDSISAESHNSVKQSMLQSLMSIWKEILTLSSSTLLSRDWTLTSNILGSSGWRACLVSRTKSPLRIPLLHRRRLGAASGISSIALRGTNKGSNYGKSCWWVTATLISKSYFRQYVITQKKTVVQDKVGGFSFS